MHTRQLLSRRLICAATLCRRNIRDKKRVERMPGLPRRILLPNWSINANRVRQWLLPKEECCADALLEWNVRLCDPDETGLPGRLPTVPEHEMVHQWSYPGNLRSRLLL